MNDSRLEQLYEYVCVNVWHLWSNENFSGSLSSTIILENNSTGIKDKYNSYMYIDLFKKKKEKIW